MYSPDLNERLKQKYDKENNLINPLRTQESEERIKFLEKFFKNKNFLKIRRRNAAKFAEPLMSILKKIKIDYVSISLLAIAFGGFSGVFAYAAQDDITPVENQKNKNVKIALSTLLGIFVGFVAGLATTVYSHRMIRKIDIERFYNRISMRLFNGLKQEYPGFEYKNIAVYNPEMALMISTMLMANMNEADTTKIQSLAIALADKDNLEKDGLQEYESGINEAVNIVKKALETDQDLFYSILQIYNGVIPRNFSLKQIIK